MQMDEGKRRKGNTSKAANGSKQSIKVTVKKVEGARDTVSYILPIRSLRKT